MVHRLAFFAVAVLLAGAAVAQPSSMDRRFLKAAARGNRAEVLLGRIAVQRGGAASIRQFGQHMIADHSAALAKVVRLGERKRITIPAEPEPAATALAARLRRKRGVAFDRLYRREMIEDHRKDIAEFEREARNGHDPEIRALAKATLPTLRGHLRMIESARV